MKISGHASPAATLAVIFTSTAFAIIMVAMRLWTRLKVVRQPGWDDLLVTISLVFICIFTVCVAFEVHYGLGRHIDTISKYDLKMLCLWLWISVWNYYIGLGLAKLSIVIQCMRIFGHIRGFQIASYILSAIIVAFTIFSTFISIFLCNPVSRFWILDGPGYCINRLPLWLFNSAFTMVTDIAVTILPMPVVQSLQLPRRQRLILTGVFGIGGVICIVSIVRLSGIYATSVTKDVSYENSQAALFSNLEASIGIVASCIPTLHAFVKTYAPKMLAGRRSEVTELNDMSAGGYNKMPGSRRGKKSVSGTAVTELGKGEEDVNRKSTVERMESAASVTRTEGSCENLV